MQAGCTQMEYQLAEYRHGLAVAGKAHLKQDFDEFLAVIRDITDEDIIRQFNQGQEAALKANKRMAKSASDAINKLIDERLKAKSWLPQAPIFGDKKFKKMGWAFLGPPHLLPIFSYIPTGSLI